MAAKKKKGMSNTTVAVNTGATPTGSTTTTTRRRRKTVKVRRPAITGRALAVTKGKGKKKGLKRQGY
jgi:hypothetical protein